ncbi:MAG: ABC transporter substrate-binding protein [Coleofasciculus sp. B1-GNL1-01]
MPKSKNFQRNFAIVIGINTYHNRIPPLQTAAPDAEELARILKEQHERLTEKYQKQQKYEVLLLLNEDATLDKFKQLLEDFKRKQITLPQGKVDVSEDDRILFYFAGHGIASDALESQDGPAGYLIPQDAILDQNNTYLPMQELHDALLELPCRHLLTILDCCFAGAFRWASLSRDLEPRVKIYKERFDRFISDRAWQVITSAADDQKALDSLARRGKTSDGKHSPFAQALFEALQGTTDENSNLNFDLNQDHILTATEIHYYLREKVETTTEEHYQRQTPGLCPLKKHQKGEFFFLLPGFNRDNLEDAPPLNLENNPYRGLESYDQKDSKLFYGRSKLIDKLCAHVASEEQAFTVILGVSGTGKSSLMKAGLLPRLVADHKYKILEMRVGDSPLTALAKVLPTPDKTSQNATQIAEEFAKDSQALVIWIKDWHKRYPNDQLLLVIDQFEELATLSQSDSNPENKTGDSHTEQQQFQELLKEAIKQCPDCFDVVVTLRLDFEAQFQEGILKEFWENARFVVPPMTQDELREVIEKPASEKVLYFEPPSLVDDLINEVVQMPGGLPLLSFTLSELYLKSVKERRENRALTDADYKALGKVIGSVTKRADEEYKTLVKKDKAYEKTVRQVMLRMVAVGDEARRRVLLSELEYPDEAEHQRAENVIDKFCEVRLLVQGTNSEGKSYVEPAHDALVQNWAQLQKWKNEQEENLILQRKLTPVANDWHEINQPEKDSKTKAKFRIKYFFYCLEKVEAFLIAQAQHPIRKVKKARLAKQQSSGLSKNYLWHNDPRLAQLDLFLDSQDNWFNKTEDEFVRESVIHKGRNTYRVWCSFALIGAGLSILTIVAVWGQRQAKIEEMLAWRESAEGNLKSDRDIRAFLDILRAVKISKHPLLWLPSPDTALAEVQETMYKAFYTVKERNRIESDRATFEQVSFNPKTNQLVTIGDGDTIRLWDKSGNQVDQFSTGQTRLYSVAFSQDGKRLATGGGNGTVKLWNLKKDGIVDYNSNNTICSIANQANSSGTNPTNTSEANPTNTSGTNPANPSGANLGNISGVAFSHDNKLLATLIERKDAQNNPTTTVNLWDIKQGKCIPRNIANTPLGQEGQLPNNQQTATRQKNQLTVPTQNNQLTVPIKDIAFSPNKNIIATVGQNNTVRLWDISGNKLGEFPTDKRNVYSLAFTPDGKLATSGDGGTIKLWTIQTNGRTATLANPTPQEIQTEQTLVYDIAFSEDKNWLATIGEDSTIRLHDRTWQSFIKRIFDKPIVEIPPIEASNQRITATSAVFSPDGKTMATIAGDDTVKFWNNLGQQTARFKTDAGDIKSIAFSPEGNLWLTSGENSEISIRDTSGEEIDTISLPDMPVCDEENNNTDENTESLPNPITQIVFAFIDTNDGTEPDEDNWRYNKLEDDEYAGMMTIFEDGTTRFFPLHEGDFKKTASGKHCTESFPKDLGLIKGLASSPDGEHLVTVGKDGDTINLWDEESDQFQQLPIPKTDNETFTSVAFSPDEKRLAIASASAAEDETGLVRIWDITQNAIVEQFDTGQGQLYSVAFSPLDSRQLVTGGGDGTVKVWDISSNRPAQFSTTQGTIQRMEFSPSQELLATISKNNQLNLWNVREDGTVSLNPATEIVQQQQGGVKNVTFSPDGETLIIVGNDDTIKFWTISTNQIKSFATQQQQIQSLAASPNKRKLATIGSNGKLKLWQIQNDTLNPIDISNSQLSRTQINGLAFSPDGKQLATAQGNILNLWTVSWGKLSNQSVDQFQTQQPIQSVAFSPNNKKIATAGNQGLLKLWDTKGNLLDQIPTQQTSITRLVFSPNSNIIATIGQNGTLNLWDTSDKSEAKLSLISTHQAQGVANVAFSQDGKFLAIGRNNGSIELRQIGNVDALKAGICNTIGDYFQNNPNRQLCGGIAVSTQRILSRGGDKLLVPSLTNRDKQAGVQGIAAGAFPTAIDELTTSLRENRNDPEALIYLNNARIGTQKSYTIAVSVPLGNTVNHGLEVLRGVAQAQDEINREGGINGVFLRVLIANDNNDPKVGKQIAQELSKNPDVLGVVGHFASDVTLAAGKVYQAQKLAAISPVSTSTQWFKPRWYSDQYRFRTAPDDNTTATTLAKSMLNKLQEKNAVVFYNSQSQYSQSLKSAFGDAVRSAGGQVLQDFDLSDLNFDAQQTVQESTQQGAKVLVLLLDREEIDDAIEIIKQKRGNQIILGGDAFYGTKLLEVAQDEENVKDMMIAVPWHISNSQSNFAETSRKLWWADVSWRTALSYDATQALIAALKQNPTRQGVAETLRSESFSVDGATGKVQFLPSGDRKNQLTNPLSQLVTIEPGSRSGYGYDFVAVP